MKKRLSAKDLKIGLLISAASEYGRGVLRGISTFARTHLDGSLRLDEPSETGVLDMAEWQPSGMIIKVNSPRIAELIYALDIPVVNVCQVAGNEEPYLVHSDDEAVGRLGAKYLLKKNAKIYAYVGWGEEAFIHQRALAYQGAIEDHGQTFTHYCPDSRSAIGRNQLLSWLTKLPKPAAIMACNDLVGHLTIEACHQAKIRVPEEVLVLGVDNNEAISELTRPGLSSIALQTEEIGHRAAELLWKILKNRQPVRSLLLDPKGVVTRGSTQSPSVRDPLVANFISVIQNSATDPQVLHNIFLRSTVSRDSVERRFRRYLGRSPLQEVHRVRVSLVKDLLINTSLPIKAIAFNCGYNAPARLIEAFIRETGLTPTQYRHQFTAEIDSSTQFLHR